jgi:hypothetical protein
MRSCCAWSVAVWFDSIVDFAVCWARNRMKENWTWDDWLTVSGMEILLWIVSENLLCATTGSVCVCVCNMSYWMNDSSGTFLIIQGIKRSQFYSFNMQIWIVKNHIIIQHAGASVWNKENQEFIPLPGSKIPSTRLILQ